MSRPSCDAGYTHFCHAVGVLIPRAMTKSGGSRRQERQLKIDVRNEHVYEGPSDMIEYQMPAADTYLNHNM